MENKAAQREEIRAKRDSITAEDRRAYETALEDRLFNLPALKHAKCIAVYNPIGSEARFISDINKLFYLDERPTIAFPIIRAENHMSFVRFDANDDQGVLANPLQIVDDIDMNRIVLPESIELVLVPGIAFDKHGNRLGQGGGYYDWYMPLLGDGCMTIGIAFDEQIVDEVVHDGTDQRVDYIVTPSRIITAEK